MIKRLFLFGIVLTLSVCLYAQTSYSSKEQILNKIKNLQLKDHPKFADGLFITEYARLNQRKAKPDNNIFFPALISLTLSSIKDEFKQEEQVLIDSINSRVRRNYKNYRNRKNGPTYNFWQTHPDKPAPGSWFWSKFGFTKIADDFDDTSIIHLTLEKNDSIDQDLKKHMSKFTNLYDRQVKSTLKHYQNRRAYMTWFAKKAKQDFDICVLSNTLLYIFDRGFKLNEYDYASIQLIIDVIKNNEHFKYPHLIASHYSNTAIILYHISRLIEAAPSNLFSSIRSKIIDDIIYCLDNTNSRMEKVLLLSSLSRLGVNHNYTLDLSNIESEFKYFKFFVGNMFYGLNITLKRILGKRGLLVHYFSCEAYYWTLVLEYIILSERNSG